MQRLTPLVVGGLCALLACTQVSGSNRNVHPAIQTRFQSENTSNVFVRLANVDLADVSSADGNAATNVYNALTSHASESQQGIIDLLEEFPGEFDSYKTYWITNAIQINGATADLVDMISERSDVLMIKEEPVFNNEQPIESGSAARRLLQDGNDWGVDRIGAPALWDLGYDGTGVVVGVIDTGALYTHEALWPSYRGASYDEFAQTASDVTFDHDYNFYTDDGEYDDTDGHGTHVTGSVAGQNGIGAAPGAKWIMAKNSDQLAACEWMLCPTRADGSDADCTKAPHIISSSWHSAYTNADELLDVITAWRAADIIPLFAIGNEGPGCSSANAPGDFETVIAIGAVEDVLAADGVTSEGVAVASYSSRGAPNYYYTKAAVKPDFVAPGSGITSSYIGSDSTYETLDGTSMATPLASGVTALLYQAALERGYSMSYDTLYETFSASANGAVTVNENDYFPCGATSTSMSPNNYYGYGMIDAVAALNALPNENVVVSGDTGTGAEGSNGSGDTDSMIIQLLNHPYIGEVAITISYFEGGVQTYVFQSSGSTTFYSFTVDAGSYQVDLYDSYGDGWNGGTMNLYGSSYACSGLTLSDGYHGQFTVTAGSGCTSVEIVEQDEATPTGLQVFCNDGTSPSCEWLDFVAPASRTITSKVSSAVQSAEGPQDVVVRVRGGEGAAATLAAEYRQGWGGISRVAKSERGASVSSTLKTVAASSQASLLSFLDDIRTRTQYESYSSLWITNAIVISGAHPALIESLASRDDVSEIFSAPVVGSGSNTDDSTPPPTTRSLKTNYDDVSWQFGDTGVTDAWEKGLFGDGVTIGVIASGVRYTHETIRNSYRGLQADGSVDHDYNYGVFSSDDPSDHDGYGTRAASLATGEGGYGVAPNAKWIAAQIPTFYNDWDPNAVFEAAQWMMCPTRSDGSDEDCSQAPHIVANAWYFLDSDDAEAQAALFQDVTDAWEAAGLIAVFMGGSSYNVGGTSCGSISSVAGLSNVIAVGEYRFANSKAELMSDSPKGPVNNVIKPDVTMASYYADAAAHDSDTGYVTNIGTEGGAGMAAGTLALIQSAALRNGLDPYDFTSMFDLITTTARNVNNGEREPQDYDSSSPCGDIPWDTFPNNYYGYGPLNVIAAIEVVGYPTGYEFAAGATPTCAATSAVGYCGGGMEPVCADASTPTLCMLFDDFTPVTSAGPTTNAPTTTPAAPTTDAPTTNGPTTTPAAPTTDAPTTNGPTTTPAAPTT
eukprot:Rmarinus@m.10798